jgi:hypothetical protein
VVGITCEGVATWGLTLWDAGRAILGSLPTTWCTTPGLVEPRYLRKGDPPPPPVGNVLVKTGQDRSTAAYCQEPIARQRRPRILRRRANCSSPTGSPATSPPRDGTNVGFGSDWRRCGRATRSGRFSKKRSSGWFAGGLVTPSDGAGGCGFRTRTPGTGTRSDRLAVGGQFPVSVELGGILQPRFNPSLLQGSGESRVHSAAGKPRPVETASPQRYSTENCSV